MRNLGPASEKQLVTIGITTAEELCELGAFKVAKMLEEQGGEHVHNGKLHRAFLYSLIGAVENKSWQEIARAVKNGTLSE